MARSHAAWQTACSLALAACLGGCASLADGAVRLAYCIEDAAADLRREADQATVRAECDLKLPVAARVVAFPAGPASRADLRGAGLSDAEVDRVSSLQLGGPIERLNVLPAARRPRPSRTTYQRRFVETPELLACWSEEGRVAVVLKRIGDRLELVGLEPGGQ